MWVKHNIQKQLRNYFICLVCLFTLVPATAGAINPIPDPAPGAGSYGLEATKTQPPPTKGATISTPSSGGSFSTSPITVSGICPDGLLVQVYDNNVMVGATYCKGGSFTMQIGLFAGQNDITATVFDDLDQAGPVSNTVTVTYNNATFTAFGTLITLTSNYGRRAAPPGTTLTWPLVLSGGSGPYAFSINWGDGSPAELKSQASAGAVNITHVYDRSGVYTVTVKVTDVNGVSAFLQLIAIGSGNSTTSSSTTAKGTKTITKVIWYPALVGFVLLLPSFWLGRRSERLSMKHRQGGYPQ